MVPSRALEALWRRRGASLKPQAVTLRHYLNPGRPRWSRPACLGRSDPGFVAATTARKPAPGVTLLKHSPQERKERPHWDLVWRALVLGSTGWAVTPAVGKRPTMTRRVIFILAAVVLTAGVWVAHGPWYAALRLSEASVWQLSHRDQSEASEGGRRAWPCGQQVLTGLRPVRRHLR